MAKNLSDERSDMKTAMRSAHQEMKHSLTGRNTSRNVELYDKLTPDLLTRVADRYGVDATIDYILAMEKERALASRKEG